MQPTNGSTTVTGTASGFTTDLVAGTSVPYVWVSDATQTQYLVSRDRERHQLDPVVQLRRARHAVEPDDGIAGSQSPAEPWAPLARPAAAVTGSGTSFTTALFPGQWLQFSNDPTKTPYRRFSAITQQHGAHPWPPYYAGTTATGLTATVQSYQSLAFHEYAIALALRPIATPPEARDVLDVMYMDLQGIPIRVMVSLSAHLPQRRLSRSITATPWL